MSDASKSRLARILQETGIFTPEQLQALLDGRAEATDSITTRVISLGFAAEEAFLAALARVMDIPHVALGDLVIPPEVFKKLPAKVVFQYNVIPISAQNDVLRVATNDPFNTGLVDALRLVSGSRVRLALSSSKDIAKATNKYYGVGADTMEQLLQNKQAETPDESLAKLDISELDQEASIVKFVNQVVWEAHKDRATDIHFEPMEDELRIRYRVDGVLHQTSMPPQLKRFQASIISRIKVMANMDIAEKRLPQDGRIGLAVRGEELDIRVSTMPTVYGESISLRLLNRRGGMLGIDTLGMGAEDEALLRKLIHKPHGILLVTGPTGSGKSTTLYAGLNAINTVDKRIITVEDPIEYEIPGVNQSQVRPEIDYTFGVGLRHILRQDPDIIMVGEIRDFETAEIAIRASLTGHLVFSTLHTNDSAGAITRLIDMGVEPFLVSSSLEAVIAQRLVRVLCEFCKRQAEPDMEFLKSVGFPIEKLAKNSFFEPGVCERCRHTGFLGRTGIFELLAVTDEIRPMIVTRETANVIKQRALSLGMRTLRDDGWRKVLEGVTTPEEVLGETEEDE